MKTLISIIWSIIGLFFGKKKKTDQEKLEEDKLLADAIKRGDAETVARIREKRRKYSSMILIFISLVFLSGCATNLKDVPLTEGNIPYPLPPGEYVDVHGTVHVEENVRWSISEVDLYRDTQELEENDENIFLNKKYYPFYILALYTTLLTFIKRKKE